MYFFVKGQVDQLFFVLCSVFHDVTVFASLLMDTTVCGVHISLSVKYPTLELMIW
jgi:hypothetical protein